MTAIPSTPIGQYNVVTPSAFTTEAITASPPAAPTQAPANSIVSAPVNVPINSPTNTLTQAISNGAPHHVEPNGQTILTNHLPPADIEELTRQFNTHHANHPATFNASNVQGPSPLGQLGTVISQMGCNPQKVAMLLAQKYGINPNQSFHHLMAEVLGHMEKIGSVDPSILLMKEVMAASRKSLPFWRPFKKLGLLAAELQLNRAQQNPALLIQGA